MTELTRLHAEIDARVAAIRAEHDDWPCTRGCDRCCRQLAALPQLTPPEWALLQTGLAALTPEHRAEIHRRITALGPTPTRPVTCPLLERDTGACPVYAQRPVACRSYGFYVQRGSGLHCDTIAARVADATLPPVVWGNHDAIDRRLAGQGEARSLADWISAVK